MGRVHLLQLVAQFLDGCMVGLHSGMVSLKFGTENRAERRDIHAEITDKPIAAIEADPGRPSMPWRRSAALLFMPENALTKKAYNGINIVSLWVPAEVQSFTAPVWGTYRQWAELGALVRKGENLARDRLQEVQDRPMP